MRATQIQQLADALTGIQLYDARKDYKIRTEFVYKALGIAAWLGMDVGIGFDPTEPEWPVAYIELPTGQVSWHLPQHKRVWDGHTSEEKYERIQSWCDQGKPLQEAVKAS